MRRLIVNADDLGLTDRVNGGIIEAATRGIVTSTSLMVRAPAAAAAAVLARRHRALAVGLHIDLAEYAYAEGQWLPRYERVNLDDPAEIEHEVRVQLQEFHRLMGRGPSHLDSHQHLHRSEPLAPIALAVAAELSVPLRETASPATFIGSFYGQDGRGEAHHEGVTVEALVRLLHALPEGLHELGVHPGLGDDPAAGTYASERALELHALCAPEVRDALRANEIELESFAAPKRSNGR